MKAISLLTLAVATGFVALPKNGFATTTKDLTLNCGGTYRVLTSVPFERENAPRLGGATYGINETVEVTSVKGVDCGKLEKGYNVFLKIGQIHQVIPFQKMDLPGPSQNLSPADYSTIKNLPNIAKARIGKIFPFQVKQHFSFVTPKTNDLPLFPFIHNESVTVLSTGGQANAQKLYGTPVALTDKQILSLLQTLHSLVSDEESSFQSDEFLSALLMLAPKSLAAHQEYANTLVGIFEKHSKKTTMLYSYSSIASLGKKLNAVIGLSNGTKFQTQLQILQDQPLLFAEPIIAEMFGQPTAAPKLSAVEVESFLTVAYDKSVALKVVAPQLYEAAILLAQYKIAANSILKYSKPFVNGPYKHPAVFALTAKSAQLLQALLTL